MLRYQKMKCGLARNLQALIQPPLKVPLLGEGLRVVLSACQWALHLWDIFIAHSVTKLLYFRKYNSFRNYFLLKNSFWNPFSFITPRVLVCAFPLQRSNWSKSNMGRVETRFPKVTCILRNKMTSLKVKFGRYVQIHSYVLTSGCEGFTHGFWKSNTPG